MYHTASEAVGAILAVRAEVAVLNVLLAVHYWALSPWRRCFFGLEMLRYAAVFCMEGEQFGNIK